MNCECDKGKDMTSEEVVEAGGLTMGHGTMPGLPSWALGSALALVVVLTVLSVGRGRRWFSGESSGLRFELTSIKPLKWLVSRRYFQFMMQVPLVIMLFVILYAGFEGTPVADKNISTVLVWSIWWTLLILDIVLLGRMWCLVCPWDALASWIRRLSFWRRREEEPLALNLKWPRWLKNVYPATFFFVGLTWLELGWGVTMSPHATAILGLCMVMLAVVPALIFERKSFCRYGCLIGRICGLYSMVAPVEVRSRDLDVCKSCRTKDCLNGNDKGYPCPTGQSLTTMRANTYCTVCTECVKSCPNDNVAINVRPWASDLYGLRKPRRDEALLALVMLSLTSFHGLTMTPIWTQLINASRDTLGLSFLPTFSLGMVAILLVPGGLYLLFSSLSNRFTRTAKDASLWRVASGYAYPLVAIALMYHLAHNAGHFLVEAGVVVPVISDPLGSGANIFGTAGFSPAPFLSQEGIWLMQLGLVLLGHWWALRATEWAHRALAKVRSVEVLPLRSRLVTAAFLLMVSAFNLWLLAQPMEMRTAM